MPTKKRKRLPKRTWATTQELEVRVKALEAAISGLHVALSLGSMRTDLTNYRDIPSYERAASTTFSVARAAGGRFRK